MNRQIALKIVNPILGLLFVFQVASGFAMKFGGDWYEIWEDAHGICAYALIVLLALHVWLNWSWIKANFLKRAAAK